MSTKRQPRVFRARKGRDKNCSCLCLLEGLGFSQSLPAGQQLFGYLGYFSFCLVCAVTDQRECDVLNVCECTYKYT